MDNASRLKILKELRRPKMAVEGFQSHELFNEWIGKVGPLLNFNAVYYENFLDFSSKLQVRGLSSRKYEYFLRQLDSLMAQAVTELEHGLTPQPLLSAEVGDETPRISISSSTIGILNTGQIGDIGPIQVYVQSLATSGHTEVAEALSRLTEAVVQSTDLSPEVKSEVLDQLNEVGRQAVLAPERRAKPGVVKALFRGIGATLGAAASLAEVWSAWGTTIKTFFGF